MKLQFELGGFYLSNSKRIQLPLIKEPFEEELTNYLDILKVNDGVLILDNNQENNCVPYKLAVYSDDYNYLVMLETISIEGDLIIRTFCNNSASREFMSMLGESYSKQSIVKDFNLVRKVFREFLEIGDVSDNLLS